MEISPIVDTSGLSHEEAFDWGTDVVEAFTTYHVAIRQLYPYLDAEAEEQLSGVLDTFGRFPTEETLNDQQELLRQLAEDAKSLLLQRWQQVKPGLMTLYAAEPEKLNAWGADEYDAARKTDGACRRWAETWLDAYDAYADDPGVADLAEPFRAAAVQALYDEWVRRLRAYYRFLKQRPVQTAARQRLKADLLARARLFAEAGKATFLTNPTIRRLFVQPRPPKPNAATWARLTLAPGATQAAGKLDLTDATDCLSVRLLVPGTNQLAPATQRVELGRGPDATGPISGPPVAVPGGRRTLVPLAGLAPAGLLLIHNPTAEAVRVIVRVVAEGGE